MWKLSLWVTNSVVGAEIIKLQEQDTTLALKEIHDGKENIKIQSHLWSAQVWVVHRLLCGIGRTPGAIQWSGQEFCLLVKIDTKLSAFTIIWSKLPFRGNVTLTYLFALAFLKPLFTVWLKPPWTHSPCSASWVLWLLVSTQSLKTACSTISIWFFLKKEERRILKQSSYLKILERPECASMEKENHYGIDGSCSCLLDSHQQYTLDHLFGILLLLLLFIATCMKLPYVSWTISLKLFFFLVYIYDWSANILTCHESKQQKVEWPGSLLLSSHSHHYG